MFLVRGLFICVLIAISHGQELDEDINRIIHYHWKKMMNSDFFKESVQNPDVKWDRNKITPSHKCIHDDHMKKSNLSDMYTSFLSNIQSIEDSHILEKRAFSSTWAPIRIVADTRWISASDKLSCGEVNQIVTLEESAIINGGSSLYKCTQNDVLTSSKIKLLTDVVIPTVIDIANKLISVESVVGNLILSLAYQENTQYGKSCRPKSSIVLPDNLFTTGQQDCDYILLVSARPINSLTTLAYAAPCSHNFTSYGITRPLAGSINFNPGTAELNDPSLLENPFEFTKVIKVGFHELTHALGFTATLYPFYVDPSTGVLYEKNVTIPATYNNVIPTYKIVTPKVLAYARNFFDCPSLDGVEIEDADPFLPGSHWEKRIGGEEYMTASWTGEGFITKLTLSLYEDMGWYRVNYSRADGHRWGYKEGCNFLNQPCSQTNWGRYFCTKADATGCNGDRTAYSYCDLRNYTSNLPVGNRYFTNPNMGGTDRFMDFCPVYQGYSNTFCQDVVQGRDFIGSNQIPQYGMNFSDTSACFEFTFVSDISTQAAGCYPLSCLIIDGVTTLSVNVYGSTVNCPTAGGVVQVNIPSLDFGKLELANFDCPPVDYFCGPDTLYSPLITSLVNTLPPSAGSNPPSPASSVVLNGPIVFLAFFLVIILLFNIA